MFIGHNSDKLITGTIPELTAQHPAQIVHKILSTVCHSCIVLPTTVIALIVKAHPSFNHLTVVVRNWTYVPATSVCTT